jgi:polysaccharide export outer membrane protein
VVRVPCSFIFAAALAVACSSAGQYIWYSELPRSEWGAPGGAYVIGVGDVLNVNVYGQEQLTTRARVRSDGRISMTLLGEVTAAGKQPAALAAEFQKLLAQFVVSPRVTVNVEEARPISVTILGEVGSRGTLTLESPGALLQAMAQAGGLTEFADQSKVFVVRQQPTFRRIRFTYEDIVNNRNGAASFPLKTGDVIMVEE